MAHKIRILENEKNHENRQSWKSMNHEKSYYRENHENQKKIKKIVEKSWNRE